MDGAEWTVQSGRCRVDVSTTPSPFLLDGCVGRVGGEGGVVGGREGGDVHHHQWGRLCVLIQCVGEYLQIDSIVGEDLRIDSICGGGFTY